MKRWRRQLSIFLMIGMAAALFCFPVYAAASDNGLPQGYEPNIYNGIPAQQFKDVFEEETIEISGISVTSGNGYAGIFDPNDTIHFRVFNSTTQETEYEVNTVNNLNGSHTLPTMHLKKNHNYIFFVEDTQYQLGTKKYVQILDNNAPMANDGPGAYDYKYITKDVNGNEYYNKEYKKLTSITVYKRDTVVENPRDDARCCIGCTRIPVVVTYNGEPVQEKLRFSFVSDVETRTGYTNYLTEGEGILYANLLEDVTYMVYLDSDKYVMDPFPIVVKDKSEYGEGRYAYNHTTCTRIDAEHPIKLFDTGKTDFDDQYDSNTTVRSLKGNVTVSGMSFRHLLILDRALDKSLAPDMEGKDCEVISITAVNPHRWEISKLAGTVFTIKKAIDYDRLVTHIYYIEKQDSEADKTGRLADKPGVLQEIEFTQDSANEVCFAMDSISLYPVVIEYDPDKTYEEAKTEERAEQAEKEKAEEIKAEKAAKEKAEQERKQKEASWNGVKDNKLPSLSNIKTSAGKRKATVKWKKLSAKKLKKAGNAKIEVQYSLSRKFPMDGTKSVYVSKKKTTVKIKSIKSKKTYYVRVRTVKTVSGVKHVSKWSKVGKVKIK